MKNEYIVTKELTKSWAKEYHLRNKKVILLFVMLCIIAVCGLTSLILLVIFKGGWFEIYISLLLLFLAIYKLFFERFLVIARRYDLCAKTYGVTEWVRITEFIDEEILLTEHTSSIKYSYTQITGIKEKGNVVFILLNNNSTIRLYKDAFVDCSWEECKERINSKSHK